MTDGSRTDGSRADPPDLDSAIEMVEREQARLADFQRRIGEVGTVVESRNKMLAVTLGGNGELRDIRFNTTAYRAMAPAELSATILETLQKARSQNLRTVQELMDEAGVSDDLDARELTSGDANFSAVLGKTAAPPAEVLRQGGSTPGRSDRPDNDDGWER